MGSKRHRGGAATARLISFEQIQELLAGGVKFTDQEK
jgi:hypothetical protein